MDYIMGQHLNMLSNMDLAGNPAVGDLTSVWHLPPFCVSLSVLHSRRLFALGASSNLPPQPHPLIPFLLLILPRGRQRSEKGKFRVEEHLFSMKKLKRESAEEQNYKSLQISVCNK